MRGVLHKHEGAVYTGWGGEETREVHECGIGLLGCEEVMEEVLGVEGKWFCGR